MTIGLPELAAARDEIAVLEALLAQAAPSADNKGARSTVATRKAAQRQAIESFDLDRLLELQDKMSNLIDVITANELNDGKKVLDDERATALMAELLDEREVVEALDARRDMIKDKVFGHLDETVGPNQNGSIEVPDLGKRFSRESCGYGTPQVDEQRLQGLLGQRWIEACDEEVVPEQIIPEHIEYRLSIEKVLQMAQSEPEILDQLRSCLIPGKLKTPRFWIRDL